MASPSRVILITGASSGIGAATARALAAPDTALVLHARRNRAGLERVAAFAAGAGAQTLILEGDLAVSGTAARLVDETVKAFGRLDVIVSNAGFAIAGIEGRFRRQVPNTGQVGLPSAVCVWR